MKYLLDVNLLLAAKWQNHKHHSKVTAWLEGKKVALCPMVELGFLRISTNPKVFNASMTTARELLNDFRIHFKPQWIPDDLDPFASHPENHDQVMDHYYCDLAQKHGFKFASLDAKIQHPVVEKIV